jgi:hypothetical protein
VHVLQMTCLLVAMGSCISLFFGRSVTSIAQGTVSILVSIDVFYAAARGDRAMIRFYAIFMLCATAVTIAIGSAILSGVDLNNCSGNVNPSTCSAAQNIYGIIMLLGSSSVGLFASINSFLVYLTMKAPAPAGPGPGASGGPLADAGWGTGGLMQRSRVALTCLDSTGNAKLAL